MENVLITNKTIIGAVASVIYKMHPYHNPENFDKIIDAIQNHFKNVDKNNKHNLKFIRFKTSDDLYNWLNEFLKGIKEFKDYNISRKLKDAGVKDADDKRNSGYKFVDRYTVETEDSRYSDFIDLNAAIRNIYNEAINQIIYDDDCFLCKYAKEYGSLEPGDERCNTCICNPKMKYNREHHPLSIKPKKEWTEEEKLKYSLD